MSQSAPANPPPLRPDWKVNSVASNEGRVAMKRPTPPKCLRGCRGRVPSSPLPQPPPHKLSSVEWRSLFGDNRGSGFSRAGMRQGTKMRATHRANGKIQPAHLANG